MGINNSEKYHFDDFTLTNYDRLVGVAVANGFSFLSYEDAFVEDRKDVLWRHDVEFEPDIALKMAEIESSHGAKASYFFQLHSQYYNIFDTHFTRVFHQIQDLGHWVGLHFDSHYYGITDASQLDQYISLDKQYLEMVMGTNIRVFSFHNTTPFTRGCLDKEYGGLINVYSSHFKNHYQYCGDSLGIWRFDRLEDVLLDSSVRHLHVLTHDANWSEEVLSPRKRMHKFIFDRAERLYNGQVNGLINKGMLCPDDED